VGLLAVNGGDYDLLDRPHDLSSDRRLYCIHRLHSYDCGCDIHRQSCDGDRFLLYDNLPRLSVLLD
jgi:hypothetical protein